MQLNGLNIRIWGIGITGMATAGFCRRRGARVTVVDTAKTPRTEAAANALMDMGVSVALGPGADAGPIEADLLVLSPGVPHDLPAIRQAANRGVGVIGEIELACRFIKSPIIALTGTNGKTTTTTLIGNMLRASGKTVFVGGNIGEPLIGLADSSAAVDWVVAEVSSFQLDTIERFRPEIGVILNVTDDHLDRYPDFAAYGRSKFRLLENQGPEDLAILNGDDRFTQSQPPPVARRWVFQRGPLLGSGAQIQDNRILTNVEGLPSLEVNLGLSPLTGPHNAENIAAAALATLAAGGTESGVREAVRGFKGLPNRLEPVAEVDGVRFYNDSKATNVDAVMRALDSFEDPIVLIMGGQDKGGSYAPLEKPVRERVRRLIVLGEAATIIEAALGGLVATDRAATMEEAVRLAARAAVSGDVILLSPACSSFDMYANYAERGADFARAVNAIDKVSG